MCVCAMCASVYAFVTTCSRSYFCGEVSVHARVDISHMCVYIEQTKQSLLSKFQQSVNESIFVLFVIH